MGRLRFGSPEHTCDFDDRTLSHVAIVVFDLLRRSEQFLFSFEDEAGTTTVWLSRNIPLRFEFDDAAAIGVCINQEWVRAMEHTAHTPRGLRLVAEPVGRQATAA